MKYIIPIFFIAAFSTGCVSVNVDVESVCASKEMNFPGVPVAISVLAGERTASVSSEYDMSEPINKLSDLATVSFSSVRLNLDSKSDLTFLRHVKVTIHSTKDASNELVLSDADFSGKELPVTVDQNKLLKLLEQGSVTMVFTGTGSIPTAATSTNTNFCVGVSAQSTKTINNLTDK